MLSRPNTALSQIHMQIMWSRLIAVVEEQAQTLVRTAFSTTVREAGDLSAGVFDKEGNMLAQAVTGTPGHVNSMAAAVKHFLDAFPLKTMRPGDHYITNDPWLTCGHLHDLTVVSPTFLNGEPLGLFASTVHVVDIGGLGMGPDGRQVFEEGLSIPLMALAREGRMNEDLLRVIRANVREPLQVEGDVYALAACNDEGSRRLVEMMEEFGIANLDRLGEHIIETSRQATIEAIGRLKRGSYRNSLTMDGYDRPLTLAAEMTIGEDGIHVDYAGTSPASAFGINVVLNYTTAYTAFGVKCLVAPEVPNNAGSLVPITVSAPEGCLLNVNRPRAVAARHTVGHMLPDVVFGCLHQVMAGGVPAEGASSLWIPQIYGGADVLDELGAEDGHERPDIKPFSTAIFHCGGAGARPGKDGLDVTAFPSGVRTIPVEATEFGGAGDLPPARVPRRLGRHRALPRRARPDHRIGRQRRHADRDAVQFRTHQQPGPRPRRRRRGCARPRHPRLRPPDRSERPAERSRRRLYPARTAGRRRFRRPRAARSRTGRPRRRRRPDLARNGPRRLPRRADPRRRPRSGGDSPVAGRVKRGWFMGMPTDAIRDVMRRTMANLKFVEERQTPTGPYEVTQLINSFLGALAHPFEALSEDLNRLELGEAAKYGWPEIKKERATDREPGSIGELIRLLRNAMAHGNIEFLSDRRGEIVALRLHNRDRGRRTWGAIVTVPDARRLLDRFVALVEERHKDHGWYAPKSA